MGPGAWQVLIVVGTAEVCLPAETPPFSWSKIKMPANGQGEEGGLKIWSPFFYFTFVERSLSYIRHVRLCGALG